jgi:4-amino-4-deoxy-L-arabinose transferase-like glycosyltransferase
VSFFGLVGASAIDYFFWILLVAAFVVEAWAFVDAIRAPAASFVAAGKQTKPLWMIILGVAFLIGIGGALNRLPIFSFLPIIAFVASAIYLADVRPKIRNLSGGSSSQGPYGPW